MRSLPTIILLIATVALGPVALLPAGGDDLPTPMRNAVLDLAAAQAVEGLEWLALDMHLHTDHSSDGGLFHQQEKDQANQDTFLDEQRDQALRMKMDAVAFTDHRNFGQHYDPGYELNPAANPLVDDQFLTTGQEWGGGRHGTGFAIQNKIDHGGTDRVGCGLAEMALEVAAQDGLLGIAHPKDGGADDCRADLTRFPLSHAEALRGGDNELQEDYGFPGGGNGSNTAWYQAFTEDGGRTAAINGSDNHFKQVWPGPSGPGGSAGYALVRARSEAGLVEAVRARRTVGGWTAASVRLTTLLDADQDGTFDAVTGGSAEPTGDAVTLAVTVSQGVGHTVRVFDDAGEIAAEAVVGLPDETIAWELPSSSAFYRATVMTASQTQVGLPDPLDYVDTLIMSSTPVWTTSEQHYGEAPSAVGDSVALGAGQFSGFGDIATTAAGTIHATWLERDGATRRIVTSASADGVSWTAPVIVATGDVRTPTLTVDDTGLVTLAFEEHNPRTYGGDIVWLVSADGGQTYGLGGTISGNAARPDLASSGERTHLVYQQQADDGTWRIVHQPLTRGNASGTPTEVAFPQPFSGGMTNFAAPPRELMHIPVAVEPVVAAQGDIVAIAWEDNRQDQTPGRSDSPDDWGIFGAVSVDGGKTFSADTRWTERRLRKDDPSDPEGMQGNPALDADLAIAADGTLHLAFTERHVEGGDHQNVMTQRADPSELTGEGQLTWSTAQMVTSPNEWSYQPTLSTSGNTVDVLWQQASDPTWGLIRATSTDGGQSWGPVSSVTTGGRYAGWPEVAGGHVIYTAEDAAGSFGVRVASLG